jgi:imidazolonepropionase-like amidohydrolase
LTRVGAGAASGESAPRPTRYAFSHETGIHHATIWPASGPEIVEGMMIIEEGKIIAIGRDLDLTSATIVDC